MPNRTLFIFYFSKYQSFLFLMINLTPQFFRIYLKTTPVLTCLTLLSFKLSYYSKYLNRSLVPNVLIRLRIINIRRCKTYFASLVMSILAQPRLILHFQLVIDSNINCDIPTSQEVIYSKTTFILTQLTFLTS